MLARGAFLTYDHPVTGRQGTTRPVWRMARRPVTHVKPAPCFGQHNAEVLTALAGLTPDAVEAMARSGLIADAPVG
jgi:crotonobetainyl-CoA:carnitine CoA-transferase CaiB-like acyl-CoA transferase